MRMPKRGEKGFTLIELLIVIAILGVLAAVIIPNISRFFGAGGEEARKTEWHNVELAIGTLMQENKLTTIPHPVSIATPGTRDMTAFPDTTSEWTGTPGGKKYDPTGTAYAAGDKAGYLLRAHDKTADAGVGTLVNYMGQNTTKYWYSCTADGTVQQYDENGVAQTR